MKLKLIQFAFVLLITVDISICLNTNISTSSKFQNFAKIKNDRLLDPPSGAPTIQATFWLQRIYAGIDAIKLIKQSQTDMQQKFFVVQGSNFYYGKNSLTRAIIEGNI